MSMFTVFARLRSVYTFKPCHLSKSWDISQMARKITFNMEFRTTQNNENMSHITWLISRSLNRPLLVSKIKPCSYQLNKKRGVGLRKKSCLVSHIYIKKQASHGMRRRGGGLRWSKDSKFVVFALCSTVQYRVCLREIQFREFGVIKGDPGIFCPTRQKGISFRFFLFF